MPFLRDKQDVNKILTFRRGHDIGELGQQLFPNGTDVSAVSKNLEEALQLTSVLVSEQKTVYEAAFIHNDVLILVDILVFENDAWNAYEIKSSLKVSETYLLDACLQSYVLRGSLPSFGELFLTTLNGNYELGEELEVKKLFKKRSVKKEAEKNFGYFESRINEARLLLERNTVPDVPIGPQCTRPYTCDFFGHCWKNTIVEKSIFDLPNVGREKLFEWFNAGIKNIEKLEEKELGPQLLMARNVMLTDRAFTDKKALAEFCSQMKTPVAAIDMEIWSPAVPQLRGTKPFQQIPFLFTLYDGTDNKYFFCELAGDERRIFAENLIGYCRPYATILVYDKSMENNAISYLGALYPDLREELEMVRSKLLDVSEPIKNMYYYHPLFKNNFSLKTVIAALAPDLSFSGISSGLEAMSYFERFRKEENPIEKQVLMDAIVEYCMKDSEATHRLMDLLFVLSQ